MLLSHESVHDINVKVRGHNTILKLDIYKAYDNIDWNFIYKIMKLFGFNNNNINMIKRCIEQVWFSIIINGKQYGFFKFNHGVRQDDPISPALYIIASDYLSRGLDLLFNRFPSLQYSHLGSLKVSHIYFVDDIMIFTNGAINSIKRLRDILKMFEDQSGLSINNSKSTFVTGKRMTMGKMSLITNTIGFKYQKLPNNYLGTPLYKGHKKSFLFYGLIENVNKKLSAWEFKLLSIGGRLILIKIVLSSLAIYLLQTLQPSIDVITRIKRLINKFFWGSATSIKKIHWSFWNKACGPLGEGGLGCKSISEMVTVFSYKLWWNFSLVLVFRLDL